ncbi:hypothetical protein EON83_24360 [bacterium]|nr:MAG: hypothetical protein EON83_24360 [bacterium]
MKNIQFISTLALLALPIVASAQPDPNNAPKGNNPVNRAVGGGRARAQIQNATPEQRQALMRTAFKRQLTRTNVTNVAQQDAVTDYVMGEAEARNKLEDATRTLQTGLRNTTVTDAQVAGLLNEYNATVADDKDRHDKALLKLKAAIDVTQYPRLEAMLTVAGLYGDSHAPTGNLVALLGGNARNLRTNAAANAGADAAPNAAGGAAAARGNALNRRNNRTAPF